MSQDKKLGFQVVFASGEDPDYPVTELNFHSPQTRGWQSPKYGEYPQEIGIQFTDGLVHIAQVQLMSHQSKIATKIELFQGTGDDYFTCQFTRLGYLSLDSNERSQHKARELKSVFLKAKGTFLKLLLHKCYLNPQNLFNQVGLIAINVLGQPAAAPPQPQGMGSMMARSGGGGGGRGGAGVHDLAVDMGMDPETAGILREVVARKEAAVADEEFELAKRLKVLQDGIKRVGGALAGLSSEKARAIEEEDYDRASRLKEEMGRIRGAIYDQMSELGLPVPSGAPMPTRRGGGGGPAGGGGDQGYGRPTPQQPPQQSSQQQYEGMYGPGEPGPKAALFGSASGGPGGVAMGSEPRAERPALSQQHNAPGSADRPIRPASHSDIYARAVSSPGNLGSPGGTTEVDATGRPVSRAIRPAVKGQMEEAAEAERRTGRAPADPEAAASPFGKRAGVNAGALGDRADPSALSGVSGAADLPAPDPLPNNPGEAAGRIADLYGEYVARCFLSKAWNLREAAILKMALECGNTVSGGASKADVLTTAANVAGNVLSKDRIANVIIAACHDLLPAVSACCFGGPDAVRRAESASALDPVLALLVDKLGDNTPKVREAAVQAILALAAPDALTVSHVVHALLRRPGKKQAGNLRGLQSRLEVLVLLIEKRSLLASIGPDALVGFCEENATFAHANGDIRHATMELMVEAAKAAGSGVMEPMLQPLLRKKQVEDYQAAFVAAGLGAGGGLAPGAGVAPAAAQAAEAPAKPAKQAKTAAASAPTGGGGGGGGAGAPAKAGKEAAKEAGKEAGKLAGKREKAKAGAKQKAAATAAPPAVEPAPPASGEEGSPEGGVCQFCGGCGPNASEQELDLHYWQSCPMLTSCGRCQQVIEIATLVEHLLDECEAKAEFEACETCGDAVVRAELDGHVEARACRSHPDPALASRCPLCHSDIPPEKEGWLGHLLDAGCPANPRTNGSSAAKAP